MLEYTGWQVSQCEVQMHAVVKADDVSAMSLMTSAWLTQSRCQMQIQHIGRDRQCMSVVRCVHELALPCLTQTVLSQNSARGKVPSRTRAKPLPCANADDHKCSRWLQMRSSIARCASHTAGFAWCRFSASSWRMPCCSAVNGLPILG